MGNRYMPDLMGLAVALFSFYLLTAENNIHMFSSVALVLSFLVDDYVVHVLIDDLLLSEYILSFFVLFICFLFFW